MTTTLYPIAIEGEAPEVWATPASASRRLHELFPAPRYGIQGQAITLEPAMATGVLTSGYQLCVIDHENEDNMVAFCQRQFLKGEGTL